MTAGCPSAPIVSDECWSDMIIRKLGFRFMQVPESYVPSSKKKWRLFIDHPPNEVLDPSLYRRYSQPFQFYGTLGHDDAGAAAVQMGVLDLAAQ